MYSGIDSLIDDLIENEPYLQRSSAELSLPDLASCYSGVIRAPRDARLGGGVALCADHLLASHPCEGCRCRLCCLTPNVDSFEFGVVMALECFASSSTLCSPN